MPTVKIMGILNATPDSFFDKSRAFGLAEALTHGQQLYREGADIIDIGGESTRPGSLPVEEKEELQRVIPVIQELSRQVPIPLSIDTCKPGVAAAALKAGARLINDITGFSDPSMQRLAAESGVDICVMHMQGTPKTMQANPVYPEGIIPHLVTWFKQRIDLLLQAGVKEQQIIIDPGIGFGKTVADNVEILQNLPKLKAIGFPVLLGASRKAFISKILNKPTAELLPGTIAVNVVAIQGGVDIIRVHDVLEHRDVINLMYKLDYKHA